MRNENMPDLTLTNLNQTLGELFVDNVKDYQDKQAFDLLYNTLQEVCEIVHRGIKDGEKGHKRALLKAQEKLRGIE